MIKRVLLFLLLLIIGLCLFLVYNAVQYKASPSSNVRVIEKIDIDPIANSRLAEAIQIKTISYEEESDFDSLEFRKYNEFLQENYPNLFERSEHKVFSEFTHLFHIAAKDNSLDPVIVMGHHDVVPIASPALWDVHPFGGEIKNDTLYGRGCMDDKGSVISILEAIELLLIEGYAPQRGIYFAFGHDEEIGGRRGAVEIVKYLKGKGVRAKLVIDEGGALTKGLVPGLESDVALIGIAEKGYASFELSTLLAGGHSSKPEKETAIDVLSTAVSKLKSNPFPRKISPPLESFLDGVGPYMDFKSRLAFSNRELFESVILDTYEKSSQGNASIRTTTSPTIFQAGIKDNVIPTQARAVVNFRIIPGETIETVKERITEVINDERIDVNVMGTPFNPSPVSPMDNDAYAIISKSIEEVFQDVVITPNLVIGGTDARHYTPISDNIYRFIPFYFTADNIDCFHGINERVPLSEYHDAIRFYRQLILNATSS